MEHLADIRHRASTINGFEIIYCESECLHIHEGELDWLKRTVADLAGEVEKLRAGPPGSAMDVLAVLARTAGLPESCEPLLAPYRRLSGVM